MNENSQKLIHRLHSKKDCELYKTGYRLSTSPNYYCVCDTELLNPICEFCLKNCHQLHYNQHSIENFRQNSGQFICQCGLNYHQIGESILENNEENNLLNSCLFSEWSDTMKKNSYFSNDKNNICLFCKNFCRNYETNNTFTLRKADNETPSCQCPDENHHNVKKIYEKLSEINLKKNFDNFLPIQLINLVFRSENSFNGIFQSFINQIDKMMKDQHYVFDPYCEDKQYGCALKCITKMSFKVKYLNYFTESAKKFFYFDFVKSMTSSSKIFNNSLGVWKVKKHLIENFRKIQFQGDFSKFPFFTVQDMANLNPLIRLLLVSNVRNETFIEFKYHKQRFVDDILRILKNLLTIKERNREIMFIYRHLYSILKVIIKYNLMEVEQIVKYCQINNKVFSFFSETRKEYFKSGKIKKANEFLIIEQGIILPIIKSLTFLVFFHNDQKIFKELTRVDKTQTEKVVFFHNDSQISKEINKNMVNVLNFIKINYHLEDNNDLKPHIPKSSHVKKILHYALELGTMNMNNPDCYSQGFRSLLDKNKIIYVNYLKEIYTDYEKNFLDFLTQETNEIEDRYQDFFDFKINLDQLNELVKNSIKKFFLKIEVKDNKEKINKTYKDSIFEPINQSQVDKNLVITGMHKRTGTQLFLVKQFQGFLDENIDAINDSNQKRKIMLARYRFLMNRTFFVFSLVKVLKIKWKIQNIKPEITPENDDDIVSDILSVLYFYIEDNIDNSIILLSSEFIYIFEIIPNYLLEKWIDLYFVFLRQIKSAYVQLGSIKKLLKVLIRLFKKSSSLNENIYNKCFKLIYLLFTLERTRNDVNMSKLLKNLIKIHEKSSILKEIEENIYSNENSNKALYISKQEQVPDAIDSARSGTLELDIDYNIENVPLNSNSEIKIKEKKYFNNQKTEKRENLFDNNIKFKIYLRFLRLLNLCFESNPDNSDVINLQRIFRPNEIYLILREIDVNIVLRTELLKLYFNAYIQPIVDNEKLSDYMLALFSGTQESQKSSFIFENIENFRLQEDLNKINMVFFEVKQFHNIIKNELLNFQKVLEKTNDINKKISYLEQGIIVPLYVYLDLFISFIVELTGYDYLKLYEITLLFLKFKKFLFENISLFKEKVIKEKFEVFRTSMNFKVSKGILLLNCNFSEQELKQCNDDIMTLTDDNFEMLNYKQVYGILKRNKNFIIKPKILSLKEYFEKKKESYEIHEIEKIRENLRKAGSLTTDFENDIFRMIVDYENEKLHFNESSFIKNLGEVHETYSKKLRLILVSFIFYHVKNHSKSYHSIHNFWGLLRLLQYDTKETQADISLLYKTMEVNLVQLFMEFIRHFMNLHFGNYNPLTATTNESYYMAINIIKIFKYLCEEHNLTFQTILFNEMDFEVKQQGDYKASTNFFNFTLILIEKIFVLANWENITFNDNDDSFSYYYDIFFVLNELLIEMIQGNSNKNLNEILEKTHNFHLPPQIHHFLVFLKGVLKNNNNNSELLYIIRKDLADLLCSFVEEKNTPTKLIHMIKNIITREFILEIIVATMKKLYLSRRGLNIQLFNETLFDENIKKKLLNEYFNDKGLINNIEFQFASRLYQFIKHLEMSDENSMNDDKEFDEYSKAIIQSADMNPDNLKITKSQYENYFVLSFFEKITRVIEVQKEKEKIKVLFLVNPMTIYLSKNSKSNYLKTVNRDSRYTKIFSLMNATDPFYVEMIHFYESNQRNCLISYFLRIDFFRIEVILFILLMMVNIFIFIFIERDEEIPTHPIHFSHGYDLVLIKSFGFTALGLNILFAIIWIFVKFPMYYKYEIKKYYGDIEPKVWNKLKIMFWDIFVLKKELLIFIWNILFYSFTFGFGPQSFYLFSIQFFIICNLSSTLKNIILAVTLRYKQFINACLFIMICINVFSSISFFFMQGYYRPTRKAVVGKPFTYKEVDENICRTLLSCFLNHLNLGLRTDGGIGEWFLEFEFDHERTKYFASFFFILLFFILIIVILLAIVAGIIIDTFTELREKQEKIEYDRNNICFVCGSSKDNLEKKGVNFEKHCKEIHNMWSYLDYMIHLKFVDKQECNAVDSFAIEMIESKSISWFPCEEDENLEEEGHGHKE